MVMNANQSPHLPQQVRTAQQQPAPMPEGPETDFTATDSTDAMGVMLAVRRVPLSLMARKGFGRGEHGAGQKSRVHSAMTVVNSHARIETISAARGYFPVRSQNTATQVGHKSQSDLPLQYHSFGLNCRRMAPLRPEAVRWQIHLTYFGATTGGLLVGARMSSTRMTAPADPHDRATLRYLVADGAIWVCVWSHWALRLVF